MILSKNILESAFIYAINHDKIEYIKLLLNQGLNPNKIMFLKKDYWGQTSQESAIEKIFETYSYRTNFVYILESMQYKIEIDSFSNYKKEYTIGIENFNSKIIKKTKSTISYEQYCWILQFALLNALDNYNSKTVKEIIKKEPKYADINYFYINNSNCNVSFICNKNIFDFLLNQDIKTLKTVYPSLKGVLNNENKEVLHLIIKAFSHSTSNDNKKILQNIIKDQIKKGLKLSKILNSEKNNLLHMYHEKGHYFSGRNTSYCAIIEFLLKHKVNPSQYNSEGKTPFHIRLNYTGFNDSARLLQLMMDYKVNFHLEDSQGQTIISNLIKSNLQVKYLIPFLKKLSLNKVGKRDLYCIVNRKKVTYSLMNEYIKRGALADYKMLEYIFPDMNKSNESKYRAIQKFSGVSENIESLLKNEKLKDFLQNAFGITSSNVTNTFLDYCKQNSVKSEHHPPYLNPFQIIDGGMILKEIFMNNENKNPNDFLLFFKDQTLVTFLGQDYYNLGSEQIAKFFSNNFTQQQSKILLETLDVNKNYYKCEYSKKMYFKDSIKMYWEFPEQLTPMIKALKFSNLNDFQKIHDYLVKEIKKLEQAPYDLLQEEKTPELRSIHQKNIGLDKYTVYVAQSNYDLINWGSELHNCVGGGNYAKGALSGYSIIVGILYDESIKYCIEIKNKQIIQMEGLGRASLPEPVLKAFAKTLKKAKILS